MVLSLPRRSDHLEIEKEGSRVIVHDQLNDYVHVFDKKTADVLEHCDGRHTCEDIARDLAKSSRSSYDAVSREVAHAVAAFADLALLEASPN